jgi:hypothetical protein
MKRFAAIGTVRHCNRLCKRNRLLRPVKKELSNRAHDARCISINIAIFDE